MKNSNTNIALYVPFYGKDGATTAKDYSNNEHTLTFVGNAKISKTEFYRPEIQSSLYLDGSGDAVTIPSNSSFNIGTGDFIAEVVASFSATSLSWLIGGSSSNMFDIAYYTSPNQFYVYLHGNGYIFPFTPETGVWYRIRAVRKNGKLSMYVNNKQIGTVQSATDDISTTGIVIGKQFNDSYYFNGYIQEVLIVNGEAWDDYAFNNSRTGHVVTVNGDAKITTAVTDPFGGNDGVGNFDGDGDYLNAGKITDLDNANKWTVSAYVKFSSVPSSAGLLVGRADASSTNFWIAIDGGSTNDIRVNINGTDYYNSDNAFTLDTWEHIEVSYDNGTLRQFLNGVLKKTDTSVSKIASLDADMCVASDGYHTDNLPTGQISDLHISKGIARHTSSFSVPTARETADEYTALLLPMAGHSWDDSSDSALTDAWNFFEKSGTRYPAKGSDNLSDNNNVGFYHDDVYGIMADFSSANSTYLSCSSSSTLHLNTTFSLHFKIRLNNSFNSGDSAIYPIAKTNGTGSSTEGGWYCGFSGDDGTFYWIGFHAHQEYVKINSTKTSWDADTLYDITVTWSGGTDTNGLKIYINGELDNQTTSSYSSVATNSYDFKVGMLGNGYGYLDGQISRLYVFNQVVSTDLIKEMASPTYYAEAPYFSDSGVKMHVELDDYKQYLTASYPLTESSGDAIDVIGGNNLSEHNTVGANTNFRGETARSLDGSADYFDITMPSALLPSGEMGISIWVKFKSLPSDGNTMTLFYANPNDMNWLIQFNNVSGTYKVQADVYQTDGNQAEIYEVITLATDTLYHFAFTAIDDKVHFYQNNKEIGSGASWDGTIETSAGTLYVGQKGDGTRYLNADICYFNFYNGVGLTPAMVDTLYNNGRANIVELSQRRKPKFGDDTLDALREFLVAYWSGDDVYDSVDHHTLTNHNGVTFTSGKNGNAFTFNGSNQTVTTPITNDLNFKGNDFTYATWVNLDVWTHNVQIFGTTYSNGGCITVWSMQSSGNSHPYYFMLDCYTDDGTRYYYRTDSWDASVGTDYHVVFSRVGDSLYFYVNNVIETTIDITGKTFDLSGKNIVLGGSDTTYYTDGKIDEILIMNGHGMNSMEVAALYNNAFIEGFSTYIPAKQYAQQFFDPELDSLKNYLVAYWNGDDVYDRIGQHTLTNHNSVTFTSGKHGNAFTLNGTDQYLTASNSSDFEFGNGDFTIFYWEKRDASTNDRSVIARDSTNNPAFLLGYLSSGNAKAYLSSNGSSWDIASGLDMGAISTTEFVFFALTRVGNTFTTYRNGSSVATITSSSSLYSSSNDLLIGDSQGASQYFNGKLGEIGLIKGYGMSSSEIEILYSNNVGKFLKYNSDINRTYPAEHLIDVFPLDEASGNSTSVKNSYTATDNNTVGSDTGIVRSLCRSFVHSNNEYLSIATSEYDFAELFATGVFSVGVWFKMNSTGTDYGMFGSLSNGPTSGLWVHSDDTNNGVIVQYTNSDSSTGTLTYATNVRDNNWHRLWLVADNSNLKMFVDNSLVASSITMGAIGDSGQPLILGGDGQGNSVLAFDGQLQEFIVLDIPVDEKFIEDDWNDGKGRIYKG